MQKFSRRAWLSWVAVGLLALLCGVLGFLQYRSIRQITTAEASRLHEDLRARLEALASALNERISDGMSALVPAAAEIELNGREQAYAAQYAKWKRSHGHLFERIAIAVPQGNRLELLDLDLTTGRFAPSDWPGGWLAMQQRLMERLNGDGRGPGRSPISAPNGFLFEVPRFGAGGPQRGPREQEWLIVELNTEYLRRVVLPELIGSYLGEGNYDVQVMDNGGVVYSAVSNGKNISPASADASVALLDIGRGGPPGGPRGRGRFGPPPDFGLGRPAPPRPRNAGGPPPSSTQGRWVLLVRNRAGSLEALVQQTQRRNIATSAAVLLLILVTVAILVQFSRRSQRLAELQIDFVAGVSHELKTPLTVIRTAAWNLGTGQFRDRPEQVERYAHLIEDESRKLQGMVEQVLQFASSKAGHLIRSRSPVDVGSLIVETLESSRALIAYRDVAVDREIASRLPVVLADPGALRQAIQNLIDNALKYGTQGTKWIGVFGEAIIDEQGAATVIRIADRGPGIPRDEQDRIFDPFFRGSRAVEDQVHGTGLGLNLVKTIVEAHGGRIWLKSERGQGAEFTIRIPAAPAEFQHEFTHSAD